MTGDLASLQALAALCKSGWRASRRSTSPATEWRTAAERHRVVGLAAFGAGDAQAAQIMVARSLRQLAECRRLADALAPVEPLFLKGLAVAALCYADPLLKQSADIDILVRRDRLLAAAAILQSLGYRQRVPLSGVSLDRWHRVSNQSVWENDDHRVELHHRPVPIDGLFDAPSDAVQTVSVAGVALATFGSRDQFAYLAIHGGLSLWFRLKWLADFAAFAERRTDNLETDMAYAAELGAGRAVALALLLSHWLFALRLPPEILDQLQSDWRVRFLSRQAMTMLQRGEPTERAFGTLPIHVAAALLAPTPVTLFRRTADLLAQRRLA